jgi:putative hydrolase of the HAD superfamily
VGGVARRPIDAVLFDFGGVLTAASPFTLMGDIGADAGVPPEQVLELMLGPYHEDTDHPFHRMERGEISGVVWFAQAAEALAAVGVQLEPGHMLGVFQALGIHDVVVERVRALRADGYLTGIITNNAREAAAGWRAMLDVDALFDVVVDSSAVGMRKPNPAIYRHALDLLGGVAPERAVFLDDAEGNVTGARSIGMHAILVGADPVPALAELDRLLAG